MKLPLLLIFLATSAFSQNRSDSYYFSVTGDTLVYPIFSINDSTYLSVSKNSGGNLIELEQLKVGGYDNYKVPGETLEKYLLTVKGIPVQNENKDVLITEKTLKNVRIGRSLDFTKSLFRAKLKITGTYKGKTFLKNYKVDQDYDARDKKDFSSETYFVPVIIKMETREVYYVSFSPRVYHPDLGTRVWAILYDFKKPGYFGMLVR
ncbi:MAG: hypothetical protein K0S12_1239 [Bacteroidetes bacterium]|nr:hypothetical protein [Bacteroidota bacterium]